MSYYHRYILDKQFDIKVLEEIISNNHNIMFLQKFYIYELIGGAENFYNTSSFLLNNSARIKKKYYYTKILYSEHEGVLETMLRSMSYKIEGMLRTIKNIN